MERMLAGLSTRRYPVGLEPVGAHTEQTATATSKSAASRRFVAATETILAQLLTADLSGAEVHLELMLFGVAAVDGLRGHEGPVGRRGGRLASRRTWPVVLGGRGWRWRAPR